MIDIAGESSPRTLGRLTGVLYLYIMIAAIFAEAFVRDRLAVSGDGVATARNIASSETLWRWGVAADVSTALCDVAVAALLYILLRPVNRAASLCAAYLRLAYAAAMAANAALLIAPLLLLSKATGKSAEEMPVANDLIVYSLRMHAAGFDVALVLFGFHLILVGLLITWSRFLPRLLGAGLAVAGACYAANSFVGFVSPAADARLFPWILAPGFLAEAALTLWLLIASVNTERWHEHRAAKAPGLHA